MKRWTSISKNRRWAVVCALLACLLLPGPAGPVARADGSDEARLYELTNQSRAQNGLPALAYDPRASDVARRWAHELARSGQLRHNPNLVPDVDAGVTRQWTRVGENVGYSGNVDQVQTAYMNSPGHRANILGQFNRVGVGAVRDPNGRLWTTVVFVEGPPLGHTVGAWAFAPFESAPAMVSQLYSDLLGRSAGAGDVGAWVGSLEAGSQTPEGLVAALVGSPESSALVDPVNRLYWAYFYRPPDPGGVNYWVNRLRGGAQLGEVSAAFAQSAEFLATYGALRDEQFVDLVYRNVLGREPDAIGRTYWFALLTARQVDRGGVMLNFTESPEFRSASAAWSKLVEVYVGLLRRAPDTAAYTYWMPQLANGVSVGELARVILTSPEYRTRFGG